jgi:hypothetical protein
VYVHTPAVTGPTAAIVAGVSSPSDKRDTERIPILGDLRGEIMVFEPLQVREISRGGASIETRYPLIIDSLHELRLTLGTQSVVLKGRVAHSRISDMDQEVITYRSGIEFIDPSERVRQVISDFLDTLKATRSGL